MAGRKWLVLGRAYVAVKVDPVSSMFQTLAAGPEHRINFISTSSKGQQQQDHKVVSPRGEGGGGG